MALPNDPEVLAWKRLAQILASSVTLEGLKAEVAKEYAAKAGEIFGGAQRFLTERDPSGLEGVIREMFSEAFARIGGDAAAPYLAVLES